METFAINGSSCLLFDFVSIVAIVVVVAFVIGCIYLYYWIDYGIV